MNDPNSDQEMMEHDARVARRIISDGFRDVDAVVDHNAVITPDGPNTIIRTTEGIVMIPTYLLKEYVRLQEEDRPF